jgi:energy-coupling factor transport system substrate-specific component
VSWQAGSFVLLALVLLGGFLWYERERPPARVLALVAALAALAVVGRLAFAAFPNVKPTTDIVLFSGYTLGAVPGFAVGAVTALVSNVFLSQGPWTVWQMAGWGGVGAGAALLARVARRREPSRVWLAVACGFAGFAFGAWMDVYQWTLASRQDLDSYLAVSASSLPYNLAHATGNVLFCLVIGPAFIRALRRYRARLEVRWEKAPPRAAAAAAVVIALAVAVGAAAPPAQAASAGSKAASYLLRAQNRDGGFPGAPKQGSSPLVTGWSALGLASARHNPRDVHRVHGRSVSRYLARSPASMSDIGSIERTILVLRSAGLSARKFAGRDLIAKVKAKRRKDGSIAGFVSYTAFGVLALRAAGQTGVSAQASYLVKSQGPDGGFGIATSAASDPDMTGAVLQALVAAGRLSAGVKSRAVGFLRARQNADGGFGALRGASSNAQSTAYAVQGLVAAHAGSGVAARATAYLKRLQRADGSIRYSRTSAQTPVWVTAQALMALRRKPLPIATAPRKKRRSHAAAAAAATPSKGGHAARKSSPVSSGTAKAKEARGPNGERSAAAGHRTARAPGPDDSMLKTDPARKTRLAAHSGTGVPGWLVALAVALALAAVFLMRRRLGRFLGARRPFLRRPAG